MSLTSRSKPRRSVDRNIHFEDDRFTQSINSPRENRLYPSQASNKHSQISAITVQRNYQSPAKDFQVREQRQIQELIQNKKELVSKIHFLCREIDNVAEEINNKDDILVNNINQDKNKWADLFEKKEQELQQLFVKTVEDEKNFQNQRTHFIKQIEQFASDNTKLQQTVEKLVNENKFIQEKKEVVEREKNAREAQLIQDLQQQEIENRNKIEDQKQEYERQLFNIIQQYNQTSEAFRNLQILKDQLLQENKSLIEEDKKNKNQISNYKLDIENRINELIERENQIRSLSAANIELDKRGEQLKRNVIALEKENQEIVNRLSNSQRMNQEFELEISTWVKKFGHLEQGHQQHLAELKRQIEAEKKSLLENEVQRQTQKLRLDLQQHDNWLRVETQKVEDMEKLYAQLLEEKQNLLEQNQDMEQVIYEMKQDLSHFQDLELDNRKMLAHIQYIEKKADQSFAENQRIKLVIDDSKAKFINREKAMQDQINRLESERDQLEKILQEHIQEIERIRAILQQQEFIIEKSKVTEQVLQDAKFQNEELNTKIKVISEDVKNLQQFRTKYHDLCAEYDKLKGKTQHLDLNNSSQKLEESLRRSSQRTVRY